MPVRDGQVDGLAGLLGQLVHGGPHGSRRCRSCAAPACRAGSSPRRAGTAGRAGPAARPAPAPRPAARPSTCARRWSGPSRSRPARRASHRSWSAGPARALPTDRLRRPQLQSVPRNQNRQGRCSSQPRSRPRYPAAGQRTQHCSSPTVQQRGGAGPPRRPSADCAAVGTETSDAAEPGRARRRSAPEASRSASAARPRPGLGLEAARAASPSASSAPAFPPASAPDRTWTSRACPRAASTWSPTWSAAAASRTGGSTTSTATGRCTSPPRPGARSTSWLTG